MSWDSRAAIGKPVWIEQPWLHKQCGAACRLNTVAASVPLQGTRLIYYNTDSDILLLAIPGAIPDHYQAFHLGFDAAIDAVPTSAVVIHHPDGSPKSISYVNSRCSAPPPVSN